MIGQAGGFEPQAWLILWTRAHIRVAWATPTRPLRSGSARHLAARSAAIVDGEPELKADASGLRPLLGTSSVQFQLTYARSDPRLGRRRVWRSVFGTTALREQGWLDDSSLSTPQVYYIHAGQIDEPQVMTDSTGSTVWNAYVEPFSARPRCLAAQRRPRPAPAWPMEPVRDRRPASELVPRLRSQPRALHRGRSPRRRRRPERLCIRRWAAV